MERFQRLRWCDWLRLLLMLQTIELIKTQFTSNNIQDADVAAAAAVATAAAAATATATATAVRRAENVMPYPTYFFMDVNGSYKYAFDTGSGITSEQSANQANEVTGQYSYFENGVPYMVKYKAGVQGYQAEIIPSDNLQAAEPAAPQQQQHQPQQQSNVKSIFESNLLSSSNTQNLMPTQQTTTTNAAVADIRQQFGPTSNPALVPTARNIIGSRDNGGSTLGGVGGDGVGVGGSGTVATLQFVQDAMQTMRNGPLQVSFTSQQRFGVPSTNVPADNSASFRLLPQNVAPPPVTNAEIQQINALADNNVANTAAPTVTQLRRYPYEFSYLSQQSSRSESADKSGNVIGKYSYYDDAGFHDLAYKAGDDIGFVVLGGSLSERKAGLTNSINGEISPSPSPLPLTLPSRSRSRSSLPSPSPSASPLAPTSATTTVGNISPNDSPFLIVNVSQQPNVNYNYRVVTDAPPLTDRNSRTRRNSRSAAFVSNTLRNINSNNNNNNHINYKSNNNERSLRKFRRNANW